MSEWTAMHSGTDGNFKDDKADGGAEKEVIDLEVEEGKKGKQIASRSDVWDHYTKIYDEGQLVKGQCKYCNTQIAAHPVHNGTSGSPKLDRKSVV